MPRWRDWCLRTLFSYSLLLILLVYALCTLDFALPALYPGLCTTCFERVLCTVCFVLCFVLVLCTLCFVLCSLYIHFLLLFVLCTVIYALSCVLVLFWLCGTAILTFTCVHIFSCSFLPSWFLLTCFVFYLSCSCPVLSCSCPVLSCIII